MAESLMCLRVGLLLVVPFLIVLWSSLLFRLSNLAIPFTQDEYLHFMPSLMGRHLPDVIEKIGPNLQPSLDFLLMRFLWIPIFGHKELALRLHALFPSLISITFIFFGTYLYFRKQEQTRRVASLFAFVLGLWIAGQSIDGMYAFTVRHYTLVGCISVLWWHEYVVSPQPILSLRFWLASLLYLNGHFFAWPLVFGAYGWEFAKTIWRRGGGVRWREVGALVASVLGLVTITLPLNFSALRWLILNPPSPNDAATFAQVLSATLSTWLGFWSYAGFGSSLLVFIAIVVGWRLNTSGNSKARERFLLCFCLLQPLIYFVCMRKSAYPFANRYQALFLGEAWTMLLFSLQTSFIASQLIWRRFKVAPKQIFGFSLAALLVFATISIYPNTERLVSSATSFSFAQLRSKVRGLNYSENFREQKWAQEFRLPLLWMHDACYESDNPVYYLSFNSEVTKDPQGLGFAYPYGYLIVNWTGCEHNLQERRESMHEFFRLYPENQVIVRLKDTKDPDCPNLMAAQEQIAAASTRFAKNMRVERIPAEISHRCIWRVQGARSVGDLKHLFLTAKLEVSRSLWLDVEAK